tara:strand:- start:6220 stop:8388 length:2169 start_codon:yes stop_codon:yes gene_type:complete
MGSTSKTLSSPTREQLVEFIERHKNAISARDIQNGFKLKGNSRKDIKSILKELEHEGVIKRQRNRKYKIAKRLPPVLIVDAIKIDSDGGLLLSPIKSEYATIAPEIYLIQNNKQSFNIAVGDRLLVKISKHSNEYQASIIRKLEHKNSPTYGILKEYKHGARIKPVSHKQHEEYIVGKKFKKNAEDGDIVVCTIRNEKHFGLREVKVTQVLGKLNDPGAIGDLVLARNDIPVKVNEDIIISAKNKKTAPTRGRVDLRNLDLVTIDDADARDFDDAVWAEHIATGKVKWRILVAIADVAFYVRPQDPVDIEARNRGNSVYLPDRVVPMLPEELSNNLCSLIPHKDRPCLAVEIDIDSEGNKIKHKFMRGIMRSSARLTYEQVQSLREEKEKDLPLKKSRLNSLYGAFEAIAKARKKRGALDLDFPDKKIILGDCGQPKKIKKRKRLNSHRLIEEFMIIANICAAETLQKKHLPCIFRNHENPTAERLLSLRVFLKSLNLNLPGGQNVKPHHFCQLLKNTKSQTNTLGIQNAILRTQSKAAYSPINLGHFGLALNNYAHFTSPIRRYSDLVVHRALIDSLNTDEQKLMNIPDEDFKSLGKHLSFTERRAAAAEHEAFDRYAAILLKGREGEKSEAHITGVEKFGLFVELKENGADAFLPIALLGNEKYQFDQGSRALIAKKKRKKFALGDKLIVEIKSIDTITGKITVSLPLNDSARKKKPFSN